MTGIRPRRERVWDRVPGLMIGVSLLYLVTMHILWYVVDVRLINLFGLGDWIRTAYPNYPMFWIFAFTEHSPTEKLQWFFLGVALLSALGLLLSHYRRTGRIAPAWGFLSAGLTIMLIEDPFNIRHQTVDWIVKRFPVEPYTRITWFTLRTTVEVTLYAVLGAIMVTALILIFRSHRLDGKGKGWLSAGYCFYGVASVASATREIGRWYRDLGAWIVERVDFPLRPEVTYEVFRDNFGFYFVDFTIEESIELLGATFLAAALLYCFQRRSQL